MSSKRFIILALFILLLCALAYPLAVDKIAIPDRLIDQSYQQFLLKASRPIHNRIIISSGSNSTRSIDASLMEQYLGRLVINTADNGSYPLEHKIYNLSNYVSAGDIILFPLEYRYYTETEKLLENYVKSVLNKLGSISFYYSELPYYKKLDFIYNHIPFTLALQRVLIPNSLWLFNDMLRKTEEYSVAFVRDSIDAGRRGSALRDDPEGLLRDGTGGQTCDEYLFGGKISEAFRVSEQFRENLSLLQRIAEDKGVKIIFTWPAVTGKIGNECYTSLGVKKKFGKLHAEDCGGGQWTRL